MFLAAAASPGFICSGSAQQQSGPPPSAIAVEGLVSVRGNEPFTGLMLVTDDRNSYILVLPDDTARGEVQRASPGRFRVSGTPYKDVWQGRDFAHLLERHGLAVDSDAAANC